jgi:hypothetical protein
MDIRAIESHYNIKIQSAKGVINKLKPRLEAFENKYRLTSEEMVVKVRQDPAFETEEICTWLNDYRKLQIVANGHGRISTGGTHMKTTNKSTIAV